MKVCIVNNDYQYLMLEHWVDIGNEDIAYIFVPHRLNEKYFKYGKVFYSPITGLKRYFYPAYILYLRFMFYTTSISRENVSDVIFFSEYDPFNAVLVNYFKERGAKIHMLEDGGINTYVDLIDHPALESKKIKYKILNFINNKILFISYFTFVDQGSRTFGRFADYLIDCVWCTRQVETCRDVKVCYQQLEACAPESRNFSITDYHRIIYLGQDLYPVYYSKQHFLAYLKKIMSLVNNLNVEFQYKPHPREDICQVRSLLSELGCNDVLILTTSQPIEEYILNVKETLFLSHSSSACFNLSSRGFNTALSFCLDDAFEKDTLFKLLKQQLRFTSKLDKDNIIYLANGRFRKLNFLGK